MKTKSKLKIHRKKILITSAILALCIAISVGVVNSITPPSCIDVIQNAANNSGRKSLIPNQDAGVFLLLQQDVSKVNFVGYVGSKTAERLSGDMVRAGLIHVNVKQTGQCVAESGLVYSVVEGSFTSVQSKPETNELIQEEE